MIVKFFLSLLFVSSSIFSQEEIQTQLPQETSKEKQNNAEDEKSSPEKDSKRYSAQFILGNGKGSLNVINDRYDPSTSLSQFVAISLFSSSLASSNSASFLSGNLNANSLLYLYLINDEISLSRIRSDSRSSINRFYIEDKRRSDSIGIQFGLSSGSYSFIADTSRYANVFLPVAFFGDTNPVVNIYMSQAYIKSIQPIYLGIDTFDIALKYHFFPADRFNLYLSAGSGIGSCFANCFAMRVFGRVGVRYNMEDYYAFIEEEIQNVFFSVKDNRFSPMQERITLIGFGAYL